MLRPEIGGVVERWSYISFWAPGLLTMVCEDYIMSHMFRAVCSGSSHMMEGGGAVTDTSGSSEKIFWLIVCVFFYV